MNANKRTACRGFTLAELLITLGIMALLVAVSVPTLGPMLRTTSVDHAASIIRGGLMGARGAAVARREAGVCWTVSGSVWDSGPLFPVISDGHTIDVDIVVDSSGAGFSPGFGWEHATHSSAHGGSFYEGGDDEQNTPSVWNFDIPTAPGIDGLRADFEVRAHWPNRSMAEVVTRWTLTHAPTRDTGSTRTVLHERQDQGGGDWNDLGTFPLLAGESYSVTLNPAREGSSRFALADAIEIKGALVAEGGDTGREFRVDDNRWRENQWEGTAENRYYVTVANKQTNGGWRTIVNKVHTNEREFLTTENSWHYVGGSGPSELHPDSYYLIQQGDPLQKSDRRQSVAYGPPDNLDVSNLPRQAAVSVHDAERAEVIWPIIFTSTGRASFDNPSWNYVTILVYDTERPNNQDYWRFIRVYRNTGRTQIVPLDEVNVDPYHEG